MKTSRIVPIAVLLSLTSCAAVAVAAVAGAAVFGVVMYERNEAYEDYRTDLATTWAAAVVTLRDLGYVVDGDPQPGKTEGDLETGDVRLVVERHADDFTRVRVRVGTFETDDHKRRAKLLLEGIRAKVQGT